MAHTMLIAASHVPAIPQVPPLRFRHAKARQHHRLARRPVGGAAKRALDVAISGSALLVLTPLFFIVAILIRLESPGPVFFRQHRSGFRGKRFKIIKFRTMRVMECGSRAVQAQRGDPRFTRLGRLLRRMSIDELPQLINVLLGHMSLVGPRPHALVHDHAFCDAAAEYPLRFMARPGITGEAQVNGARGPTHDDETIARRLRYDLRYVRHWSIGRDLSIIARTLPLVVTDRAAF